MYEKISVSGYTHRFASDCTQGRVQKCYVCVAVLRIAIIADVLQNCGEQGHLSRDCTIPQAEERLCYKCKPNDDGTYDILLTGLKASSLVTWPTPAPHEQRNNLTTLFSTF